MTVTELETVAHWIGGERVEGDGRYGDVTDPATGAVTRRVALAGADDVDRAVTAAAAAFESWSAQSLTRRSNVLFAFRELLAARAGELARVITAEHGKTRRDALRRGAARSRDRGVRLRASRTRSRASCPRRCPTGVDARSLRQPLGVCAGITPFNFPAMVPMWMFPLAIACGNTFVLKPSEKDPSASMLLAELVAEAGLPDGVLNVVHGDKVAVDALLEHPRRRRGLLRRLHARSPATSTRPPPRTASASRRSAARRTTWWCCRTPTWTLAADAAVSRRLRLRGRALHGDLRGRRRRRRRRRAGRRDRASASTKIAIGPGRRRDVRDGPADHRGAPRPGGSLRRARRRRRAPSASSTAGRSGRRHRGRLLDRRRRCSTRSPRTCRPTATRSSARCCACCARTPTRRRST